MSSELKDVTITLTSRELTALSDILRRQQPRGIFTGMPEFRTALCKIEDAKHESYGFEGDPADTGRWVRENFPLAELQSA